MSNFLEDYLLYNNNNECPELYHIGAALATLSSVVSRKVYLDMEYFVINANLYICLVGKQGFRKTTAKDIAYDILREVYPDLPVSAESMSKEAITKFMAGEEQERSYVDETNTNINYHPFTIFITELKNFLSINPVSLLDFLTTIYDRKFYDVITKNKGSDIIENPYIVFFACETPDWIVDKLKLNVISGGFSRRVLWIYELSHKRIPFPRVSAEARAALERAKEWLRKLRTVVGPFVMTPEARAFYEEWYMSVKFPEDQFMSGYFESKHIQLLKICMLLALCEDVKLVLDKRHLQIGLELLARIEVNMPKLSLGIGRNTLAAPTARVMETIEASGGMIPEARLRQIMFRDMTPEEMSSVIAELKRTEVLFDGHIPINGLDRLVYMNKEYYQKVQEIQRKKKEGEQGK